jgi:hypothetical protein
MASLSVAGHLLKALGRAVGRVVLTFLVTLIVVGGGYALLHLALSPTHTDTLATYLVAAALGVGWAIALSLLVLTGEVIKVAIEGVRDAAKGAEQAAGDVVRTVEGRGQQK